jgi:hypothetical protein
MNAHAMSHPTILLVFGVVAACGAYVQPATRVSETTEIVLPPRAASARTLERRDIAPYEGRSLAEALSHLRPDWLRVNPSARFNGEGERAVLYVNDVPSGDLAQLQLIASDAVAEVRLLSLSEAWARFGPQCRCPAGAISVRTRSMQ